MELKQRKISRADADVLFGVEEDNLGPGERYTFRDYFEFVEKVVGFTIWEYCVWRNPDNPEEQFELIKEKKFI